MGTTENNIMHWSFTKCNYKYYLPDPRLFSHVLSRGVKTAVGVQVYCVVVTVSIVLLLVAILFTKRRENK
jgi:hypothetical protein